MNFPFVPNGKFIIFRCPKSKVDYSLITMCLNTGTPKKHNFSFETNGKLMALGVPILKNFRVKKITSCCPTPLVTLNFNIAFIATTLSDYRRHDKKYFITC